MKRMLLIAMLALTLVGAKKRAVDPRPACGLISDKNLFVAYTGAWSGCSPLSPVACLVNEPIDFRVGAFGYDGAPCGHRAIVSLGDGSATQAVTERGLPAFEHTYRVAGTFRVFVTVSNARTVTVLSREVRVEGGVF